MTSSRGGDGSAPPSGRGGLLEALPEPALIVSPDGLIAAANRHVWEIFGLDRDAAGRGPGRGIPGSRLQELVEDAEGLLDFLRSAARSRSPVPGTLRVPAKGGSAEYRCTGTAVVPSGDAPEVRVLVRIAPDRGRASRFMLLNRKIEELNAEVHRRRKVEQELLRNRYFLEESQKIARLGSWEWDVRTDEIAWSEELFEIYGLDPSGPPPDFRGFLDLVAPEDRERVRATVYRALETGEPFSFDHGIVRPDGTRRTLHGRGRVLTDESGSPVRMMGSGQDITERKRRENQRRFLAEAGELLASSLDYENTLENVARLAVPEIADWCAVDLLEEGRAHHVALTHDDPEKERFAREFYRRWPPDLETSLGVGRALTTGEPEYYPEITDGLLREGARDPEHLETLRALDLGSVMVVPMRARGRTLGAITLATGSDGRRFTPDDLEFAGQLASRAGLAIENARAYRDAQRAVQARDEIVAVVSHDLRGPLDSVAGAAALLSELTLTPEKREEQIAVIRRSAEHMDRLTRDLLDVAKLEAGRLSIRRREHSVGSVLEGVEELLRPKIREKDLTLRTCVTDGTPGKVRLDPDRLDQVLHNLLGNAVKFTPPGGEVSLTVAVAGDELRFEIRDTGPGIPPDQLPNLFDRFWRGDTGAEGGAGLGLTIARGLVEAHGGRIEAENAEDGAVFRFWIPLDGA